jgi:DNA-binding IclR family transcriptional regulator
LFLIIDMTLTTEKQQAQEILEVLREHPEGITLDELVSFVGYGRTLTRNRLHYLLSVKKVEHTYTTSPPLWLPR